MKTSGPTSWLIWPAAPARVSSDANQMNLARGGLLIFVPCLPASLRYYMHH